jgi:hypothetical protein
MLTPSGTSIENVGAGGSGGSSTLAGLTDVAISSPANGQLLVYNSATSKWDNNAGSVTGRSTNSVTTGTLATNAIATGSVSIANAFDLLEITFSCKARVELYSTAAFQASDAARAWGTLPTAYTQNGLCCDVQVTSGSFPVTWVMSPIAPGFNADVSISTMIYYQITNLDTSQAVTITFTFVPTGATGTPSTDQYILGAYDTNNLPNAIAIPSLYHSPDILPITAGSVDDEFSGSSLSGSWTWVNQGSTTATVANSLLCISTPAHSGISWSYIYKAAPGTPWQIVIQWCPMHLAQNYCNSGLVISDSSGKMAIVSMGNGAGYLNCGVLRYNSPTSYSSEPSYTYNISIPAYLSIKDDGTNLYYYCSNDGHNFLLMYQESRTAWFTSGPTRVGVGLDLESGNGPSLVSCDWFRRTL